MPRLWFIIQYVYSIHFIGYNNNRNEQKKRMKCKSKTNEYYIYGKLKGNVSIKQANQKVIYFVIAFFTNDISLNIFMYTKYISKL